MYLNVIALDLDGTIAEQDTVDEKTWKVLRKARTKGFSIILVTGRQLNVISDIGPFEEVCDAIVAENGAAVFFPKNNTVLLPFGHLAKVVIDELKAAKMPLERGMAIAATWVPHDKQVLEILSRIGYAATVEYNKGAVMILPPGATKGTGLLTALNELGFSPHNVVAFGDAENDRSFFQQAELAVAVANATPEIKAVADVILDEKDGAGVRSVIQKLMAGEIPPHYTRDHHKIQLGKMKDDTPIEISPVALLNGNLCIAGSSGTGKSWLAGFLIERLLHHEYQLCVIDPEGDYRSIKAFSHTLLLGGTENAPPPVNNVITLLEYSNISLILDLSLYTLQEKVDYVAELMAGLCNLRARRGKPHWFLLDEAHYFCPKEGNDLVDLMIKEMKCGGFGMISYRPSQLNPAVLKAINSWVVTCMKDKNELTLLNPYMEDQCKATSYEVLSSLGKGQAYLCMEEPTQLDGPKPGIVEYRSNERTVPHVRHLHKYLRAPCPTPSDSIFMSVPTIKDPGMQPVSGISANPLPVFRKKRSGFTCKTRILKNGFAKFCLTRNWPEGSARSHAAISKGIC